MSAVRTAAELPAALDAAEACLLSGDVDEALSQLRHAQEVFWGPEPAARIRARLVAYRALQRAGVEPVVAHLLALGVHSGTQDDAWGDHIETLSRAGFTDLTVEALGSLSLVIDLGIAAYGVSEGLAVRELPLGRLADPLRRTLGAEGLEQLQAGLGGDRRAAGAALAAILRAAQEHHVRRAPRATIPPPPEPGLLDKAINPWLLALIGFGFLGFFFYELAHASGFLGWPGIIALILGSVFVFAGAVSEGGEVRPSIAILGLFFGGLS